MKINANFTKRAAMFYAETAWAKSPAAGVERKMLDRIGDEVARATTIVRFAPGSEFAAHTHDGGEEYLVLDGVFQDESGDFPKGSYVRNPPTTRHKPSATKGATILVKLHQFDPEDRTEVSVETADFQGEELTLFSDSVENVRIEVWPDNQEMTRDGAGGTEVFVLDGGFEQGGDSFGPWDWLRLPKGQDFVGKTGPDGARVWLKTGHLKNGF